MMRRSIARVALFALAFAPASLLPLPAHAQGDGPLKAEDLAGAYEIVSGEKFGIPEPSERIKGSTVRFTKDRVVVMDKESKEIYGAAYSLEATEAAAGESESGATASKIKMTSKLADSEETVAYGLVDKDGDQVRLVYALPGGEVPREFKTKDKQLLFVLKKKAD
ncbi:hypothetical protein [Planctomyces sp. SH-PL62]|uniref:hypothetical protein n=1 Tax=Planctomyces sp. SH-PL62 TaxID=1636152 RepID=UPI00078EEF87|nr:hypothetical protein [Planctomyces sp. SH-PL62]AMV35935.1 hypothetical protein VT85_00725 [Planctomyces sp. SH-PL62]